MKLAHPPMLMALALSVACNPTLIFSEDEAWDAAGDNDRDLWRACGDAVNTAVCDCDDTDASIHPEAEECGEGLWRIDNDCDGVADEECDAEDIPPTPTPTPAAFTFIDSDGDGASDETDCDDGDSAIYPGAAETCDLRDQDCDGAIDEGPMEILLPDADGDGYAALPPSTSCPGAVYRYASQYRGDCDDSDAQTHPFAEDDAASAKDTDCGGLRGPDLHVISDCRPSKTFACTDDLQDALVVKSGGVPIWPGVYEVEDLVSALADRALFAVSTDPASTVLDAGGAARVLSVTSGSFTLDGLTVRGGDVGREIGGGILHAGGDLIVRSCIIEGNSAGYGGGIASGRLGESDPVGAFSLKISHTIIRHNYAATAGGGVFLDRPLDVEIRGTSVTQNGCPLSGDAPSTEVGGGVAIQLGEGEITVSDSDVVANSAAVGGGMYLYHSFTSGEVTVDHTHFAYNDAQTGAGMAIEGDDDGCPDSDDGSCTQPMASTSAIVIQDSQFLSNSASAHGGGMFWAHTGPVASRISLQDNTASGDGAALYVEDELSHLRNKGDVPSVMRAHITATHSGSDAIYLRSPARLERIVAHNDAPDRGCILAGDAGAGAPALVLSHSILTSQGDACLIDLGAGWDVSAASHNALWRYGAGTTADSSLPWPDESFIIADPQLLDPGVDPHLAPTSPLVNRLIADPDADGSAGDLGLYGGEGGALWDRNHNGRSDYYWPGDITRPPPTEGAPTRFEGNDDWPSTQTLTPRCSGG